MRSAPPPERRQRTTFSLPFEGTWIVSQGYRGATSHRGYAAYALDFVKLDAQQRAYVRSGKRAKHWHSFGAKVLATANGVVVRAIDDFDDNPILGRATQPNRVIVRHADDELSEYVHLQRGSLRVRVGERVRRGQVLARSGNSGARTPHLHWALLSSVDPIRTRPAAFDRYEVRDAHGGWHPARGVPREGDVIRPASRGRRAVGSGPGSCYKTAPSLRTGTIMNASLQVCHVVLPSVLWLATACNVGRSVPATAEPVADRPSPGSHAGPKPVAPESEAADHEHGARAGEQVHEAGAGEHAHGAHEHGSQGYAMDFSSTERFAAHFDDPERDAWQKPQKVLQLLDVKPGQRVVDLGAGTGYFEAALSDAVGEEGHVLREDRPDVHPWPPRESRHS